jgi:hypothetical protein
MYSSYSRVLKISIWTVYHVDNFCCDNQNYEVLLLVNLFIFIYLFILELQKMLLPCGPPPERDED